MTEVRVVLDDCVLLNPEQVKAFTGTLYDHQLDLYLTRRALFLT
jgi:hypothetical protein